MTLTIDQQQVRARGIFATDVARIMTGNGPRVALEKLGLIERENSDDEPAVRLGNILEAPVLAAAEREIGWAFERGRTCTHPTIPWLGAHPDGIGEGFCVESKAWSPVARMQFGEPGSDEVPEYILWQTQAQMAVTGAETTYVPIAWTTPENLVKYLTLGEIDVDIYVVPRSEKLIEVAIAEAGKVWRCMQERVLPEPIAIGDAQLIYRQDNGSAIEATQEVALAHAELMNLRPQAKRLDERIGALKETIECHMGEAAELYHQGLLLATWKKAKDGQAFDVKAFERAHPEMYRAFLRPTIGSRRFLPKAV